MNIKKTMIFFLLYLISACGSKSNVSTETSEVITSEEKTKLTDTLMWRNNECFYWNGTGLLSYSEEKNAFADDILEMKCTSGRDFYDEVDSLRHDEMSITNDVDLFVNLTSLSFQSTDGNGECCSHVGSLNNLSKIKKLESLTLNTEFDRENTDEELWGNLLSLKRVSGLNSSDIYKITSLETLNIYVHDSSELQSLSNMLNLKTLALEVGNLSGAHDLSSLVNLETLDVTFKSSKYIDASFIHGLSNLKALSLGVYKDEIGDIGFEYSDDDLYIKNFEILPVSLTKLRDLNIYGLSLLSFNEIQNFTTLEKLSIDPDSNFYGNPQDISSLVCGDSLSKLYLSKPDWNEPGEEWLKEEQLDPSCWGISNLAPEI